MKNGIFFATLFNTRENIRANLRGFIVAISKFKQLLYNWGENAR